MGEAIWCNVKVKVPTDWFPPNPEKLAEVKKRWVQIGELYRLTGALELLDAALCNGETEVEDGGERQVETWSFYGEGNYGLFDSDIEEALDMLREARVPYLATCEAKYEYEPEWWLYDGNPQGRLIEATTTGEQFMLGEADYRLIVAGNHPWARSVEDYFAGRDLLDEHAAHLIGTPCPWNEDD